MGLYLTCADTDHLNASIRTIGLPIPVPAAYGHNPANNPFLATLPLGGYHCWGCTEQRTPTFERLHFNNVRDEVLISENGTRIFNFHAILIGKLPHPDTGLATSIWSSHHQNIFLVSNIRKKNIAKVDFMHDLTGNGRDNLTSPRYMGPNHDPALWNRYLAIKGRYGL